MNTALALVAQPPYPTQALRFRDCAGGSLWENFIKMGVIAELSYAYGAGAGLSLGLSVLFITGQFGLMRRQQQHLINLANRAWQDVFLTPNIQEQLGPDHSYEGVGVRRQDVLKFFSDRQSDDGSAGAFQNKLVTLKTDSFEYYFGMRELARIVYEGDPKNTEDAYFCLFLVCAEKAVKDHSPLARPLLALLSLPRIVGRSWSPGPQWVWGAVAERELVQKLIRDAEPLREKLNIGDVLQNLSRAYRVPIKAVPKTLKASAALNQLNQAHQSVILPSTSLTFPRVRRASREVIFERSDIQEGRYGERVEAEVGTLVKIRCVGEEEEYFISYATDGGYLLQSGEGYAHVPMPREGEARVFRIPLPDRSPDYVYSYGCYVSREGRVEDVPQAEKRHMKLGGERYERFVSYVARDAQRNCDYLAGSFALRITQGGDLWIGSASYEARSITELRLRLAGGHRRIVAQPTGEDLRLRRNPRGQFVDSQGDVVESFEIHSVSKYGTVVLGDSLVEEDH